MNNPYRRATAALERANKEKQVHGGIETEHHGYLVHRSHFIQEL